MRKLIAVLSVAVLALGAAACGGGIEAEDVEDDFEAWVELTAPDLLPAEPDLDSIDCDDDIEAEEGTKFECQVEDVEENAPVICEGEVTSVEGDQAEADFYLEDCRSV